MSTERDRQRLRIAAEAGRRAVRHTNRSYNCAVATEHGFPLDQHSKTCIGVTEPDKCLCECHDPT